MFAYDGTENDSHFIILPSIYWHAENGALDFLKPSMACSAACRCSWFTMDGGAYNVKK